MKFDINLLTQEERRELNHLSHKVLESLFLEYTDPKLFEAVCDLYNDFRDGLVEKYTHGEEE